MNLLDGEGTPPATAFEAVARMAGGMGVPIARSELVGLVPRAVVARSFAASLRLEPFGRESILEERVEAATETSFRCLDHAPAFAPARPAPGEPDAVAAASPSTTSRARLR